MNAKDYTGIRGERIALVRLSEVCRDDDLPFFEAHFLGDKHPLFDALVELVGVSHATPYFFAQVKATRLGYTSENRLRVEVAKDDVRKMARFPAPAYVIGVDEKGEKAFVVAVVAGMEKKISSLNTAHPLNRETLRRLWDEVREYWQCRRMERNTTAFSNEVTPCQSSSIDNPSSPGEPPPSPSS
jgi:hypothetical protein